MTKKQFEQLMEKLDRIERELQKPDKGTWAPVFVPPLVPQPTYYPAPWPLPQITD